MEGRVSIELLGGFAVRVDDRVITSADFERRSGAELVQLLALAPNRRLHRDRIIDQLWPDLAVASAVNQFHKASSFARKGLGDRTAIVVRDEVVSLFPEREVVCDVDLVDRARADDPDSVVAARSAYRGDLLPDTPFADWAIRERERLRLTHLRLLEDLRAWDDLAELDPCHETAQVALMERALAAGDRAAAIRRFNELASALADHIGVEPGADAMACRDRALADPPPPSTATATATNAAPSTVAGREVEADQVVDLLGRWRVVTVVGPGGVGKTHLAMAVLDRLAGHLGTPPVVVPLGRTDDPSSAGQEVLRALGAFRQTDTGVTESITRAIGSRPVTLVFDNCEHLLDAVRPLVIEIVDRCPHVRILATSRRAIDCDEEHLVRLGPLPRPAAVRLFASEAARHDTDLDPDDPSIDRVCELVDDLPLAIRLAAARTRALDLRALVDLLGRDLGLIDRPDAGAERTLREAVSWSIDALTPSNRTALSALSAFADRFDLEAALEVIGDDGDVDALTIVDDLVASSLVSLERANGSTRYRLPEAIRYFARSRGIDDAALVRHVDHVSARIERASRLMSEDSAAAIAAFDDVWSDVPLAIHRGLDVDRRVAAHRIIAGSACYASSSSAFEILDWCEWVLGDDADATDPAHADALACWASMLAHRLELDRARAAIGRISDDLLDRPPVLFARGWLCFTCHEIPAGNELFERLLDRVDVPAIVEADTITLYAVAQWNLGGDLSALAHRLQVLAAGRGPVFESQAEFVVGMTSIWTDPGTAIGHLDRAAEVADHHRQFNLGGGIRSLRVIALGLGGHGDDALAALAANLRRAHAHGSWTLAIGGVATAALLLDGRGRTDLAVTLAAAQDSSGFVSGFSSAFIDAMLERTADAEPELFDGWWRAGARLDARGATGLAIELIDRVLAASPA